MKIIKALFNFLPEFLIHLRCCNTICFFNYYFKIFHLNNKNFLKNKILHDVRSLLHEFLFNFYIFIKCEKTC